MITDTLRTLLANTIEASFVVQGYHWDVEGPNFNEYHDFFSTIYGDYYAQVDPLAEYIRIVSDAKEYVNASTSVISINKTIKQNVIVGNEPIKMCKAIQEMNAKLIDNYNQLFKEATEKDIQGLADYCASRLDSLNKLNWKLVAITK